VAGRGGRDAYARWRRARVVHAATVADCHVGCEPPLWLTLGPYSWKKRNACGGTGDGTPYLYSYWTNNGRRKITVRLGRLCLHLPTRRTVAVGAAGLGGRCSRLFPTGTISILPGDAERTDTWRC